MLVATATVIHRVFTFDKSLTYTIIHGAILIASFTAFSTWHCIKDELIMHSVIFAIMIAVVGIKTRSIINARVIDPVVQKDVQLLTAWGGGMSLYLELLNLGLMVVSDLRDWIRDLEC